MLDRLYESILSSDKDACSLAIGILEANAPSLTLEEISVFWLLLASLDSYNYKHTLKILHMEYVSGDKLEKTSNWPGWYYFKNDYTTYSEAKHAINTKYKSSLYLIERRRIWK